MIEWQSGSPSETKRIGRRIGRHLRAGHVVALQGPLGAGKTTLVKGIARGLDVPEETDVLSPSFVLIHEYEGREKIFHIDWYRLRSLGPIDASLAEECFRGKGVALIEWSERGRSHLPPCIRVRLVHRGPLRRKITVSARNPKYADFMKRLKK